MNLNQVNPQSHLNCRAVFYFQQSAYLFYYFLDKTSGHFFDNHLHAISKSIFNYKFVLKVKTLFLLMKFFLFIPARFVIGFLIRDFLLGIEYCRLFFNEPIVLVELNFVKKNEFQININLFNLFFLIF